MNTVTELTSFRKRSLSSMEIWVHSTCSALQSLVNSWVNLLYSNTTFKRIFVILVCNWMMSMKAQEAPRLTMTFMRLLFLLRLLQNSRFRESRRSHTQPPYSFFSFLFYLLPSVFTTVFTLTLLKSWRYLSAVTATLSALRSISPVTEASHTTVPSYWINLTKILLLT